MIRTTWIRKKSSGREEMLGQQLLLGPLALADISRIDHDGADVGVIEQVVEHSLGPAPAAPRVCDAQLEGAAATTGAHHVIPDRLEPREVGGVNEGAHVDADGVGNAR